MTKSSISRLVGLILLVMSFGNPLEALPYRSHRHSTRSHKKKRLLFHKPLIFQRKFAQTQTKKTVKNALKTTATIKTTIAPSSTLQATLSNVPKLPPREDTSQEVRSLRWVYKRATRGNLDLKMLRQRLVQAKLMKEKAWAILKPSLMLQAGYTRHQAEVTFDPMKGLTSALSKLPIPPSSKKDLTSQKSDPVVITPLNQLTLALQLNWNFFNLQSIPMLQSVDLGYHQALQNAKRIRRDLLFNLTRAYYNTLLAEGLVSITRQSWQNSYNHFQIALERYKAGLWTELKVMRAKLDVVKARQNWLNARNSLRKTKLSLAALLNIKKFPYQTARPKPIALPDKSREDWLKIARRHRLELKVKKLALSIARKKITQIWMKFFPTVSLGSGFRMSNSGGFSGDKTQWNISLNAKFPIYLGGSRYVELREAHSKYRQAQIDYEKTQRNIAKEIDQVLLDLRNAKATLLVARTQLQIAQRSFLLYQQRYKAGLATPVALSDAQTQLMAAQIAHLRAKLNLDLVALSLQRAAGLFHPK